MVLLVTDIFLVLTQVLLWILVAMAARFVLLKALPKAFLGGLVLLLLVVVAGLTFFNGKPDSGILGDIWQLMSILFNPLGLLLVLLAIVWRDAEGGKLTATSKLLLRIGVASLILFSIPLVSYFMMQRAEFEAIQITQPVVTALPPGANRVIVLLGQDTTRLKLQPRQLPAPVGKERGKGNGLFSPPEPLSEGNLTLLADQSIQLTEKGSRILYAAQLFGQERGNAPLLVVTSGGYRGRDKKEGEDRNNISQAADISRFLQARFGIPAGSILTDNDSPTVQSSAANVKKLLKDKGINTGGQLMVVTSALEASRTALTFAQEFGQDGPIAVISRPTDFYTIPPKDSMDLRLAGRDLLEWNAGVADIVPSADALSASTKVISEWLTSLYYFLRGWIRPLRAG
jgi:uncharacterized SAM-binding protein YcdF (DUF218 family)